MGLFLSFFESPAATRFYLSSNGNHEARLWP